jgi:hypothetical protein
MRVNSICATKLTNLQGVSNHAVYGRAVSSTYMFSTLIGRYADLGHSAVSGEPVLKLMRLT